MQDLTDVGLQIWEKEGIIYKLKIKLKQYLKPLEVREIRRSILGTCWDTVLCTALQKGSYRLQNTKCIQAVIFQWAHLTIRKYVLRGAWCMCRQAKCYCYSCFHFWCSLNFIQLYFEEVKLRSCLTVTNSWWKPGECLLLKLSDHHTQKCNSDDYLYSQ